MNKKVAIIASGNIQNFSVIKEKTHNYRTIIAADGGLIHCKKMDITPDLIVGDMDSAPTELLEEYSQVEIRRCSPDKDETDLELAIEAALSYNPEKVTIFGALEKRCDHSLYNLYLICRHPKKVYIESEKEILFVINEETKIPCFPGQTISLIPLGNPCYGVTTKGLKWELENAVLDLNFMSISNVCLNNFVKISINSGNLLCIKK